MRGSPTPSERKLWYELVISGSLGLRVVRFANDECGISWVASIPKSKPSFCAQNGLPSGGSCPAGTEGLNRRELLGQFVDIT
jgi:hypothetical protein